VPGSTVAVAVAGQRRGERGVDGEPIGEGRTPVGGAADQRVPEPDRLARHRDQSVALGRRQRVGG
jgi:hypothetical protein